MRDQDRHGIGALLDVSGAAIQAETVYQPQTACPSRAVCRGRVQVKFHLHRRCQMAENVSWLWQHAIRPITLLRGQDRQPARSAVLDATR